jgi:hypothetical protein
LGDASDRVAHVRVGSEDPDDGSQEDEMNVKQTRNLPGGSPRLVLGASQLRKRRPLW